MGLFKEEVYNRPYDHIAVAFWEFPYEVPRDFLLWPTGVGYGL